MESSVVQPQSKSVLAFKGIIPLPSLAVLPNCLAVLSKSSGVLALSENDEAIYLNSRAFW
jgi:hypothetical protein